MSKQPECVVEIINRANQAGNPVFPAIEIINSATAASDDPNQLVIACGRCAAEFTISTELGEDKAQLKLATPSTLPEEACASGQYRQVGDWVTNLNPRWFGIDLVVPEKTQESVASNAESQYRLSATGLERVLDSAAHDLATARSGQLLQPAQTTERLQDAALNSINVLDLILVRRDGKTWGEEIESRAQSQAQK